MEKISVKKTLCLTLLFSVGTSISLAYEYGDPSAAEQAHLEAINWARANPTLEATRLGLSDVTEGTVPGDISGLPMPPLTMNNKLREAALSHSDDMALNDFFSHDSQDGTQFYERVSATGYTYKTTGENIAWVGSTGTLNEIASSLQLHDNLFTDDDYPNRGHRVNILSGTYREIGIGLTFGIAHSGDTSYNSYYVTTDFGTSQSNDQPFVVGVVYDDLNNDGWYTAGEGLAGITVTVKETGAYTTTASAGGYAIPMTGGSNYTMEYQRDNLRVIKTISIANDNVKIDIKEDEFSSSELLPPAEPVMSVTISNRTNVNINWNNPADSTSYLLSYAPYPYTDAKSIGTINMGNSRNLDVVLSSGDAYYVAVQAVNSSGMSNYSNIELIIIE